MSGFRFGVSLRWKTGSCYKAHERRGYSHRCPLSGPPLTVLAHRAGRFFGLLDYFSTLHIFQLGILRLSAIIIKFRCPSLRVMFSTSPPKTELLRPLRLSVASLTPYK